jgi:hypothetical protein
MYSDEDSEADCNAAARDDLQRLLGRRWHDNWTCSGLSGFRCGEKEGAKGSQAGSGRPHTMLSPSLRSNRTAMASSGSGSGSAPLQAMCAQCQPLVCITIIVIMALTDAQSMFMA